MADGSAAQLTAAGDASVATRPPARLYVQRSGQPIGSLPLALGVCRRVPEAGDPVAGVAIELVVLGWQIAVGDLVGPGNLGSSLWVAWRDATVAAQVFQPPPVDLRIVSVLRGGAALQSVLAPRPWRAPSGYGWSGSGSVAPAAVPSADGASARAYDAFSIPSAAAG